MAVLRPGAKTSARDGPESFRGGNRLAAGKLELCPRGARTKPSLTHWRGRLDHQKMVSLDIHRIGRIKLGRSMAAKYRSQISQNRPSPGTVLRRHAGQTNP